MHYKQLLSCLGQVLPPSNVIGENEWGQSPVSSAPTGLACDPLFYLSHVSDHTSELRRNEGEVGEMCI